MERDTIGAALLLRYMISLPSLHRLLPPALSLLVLVANWHCAVGAVDVVQRMSHSHHQPEPLQQPAGCENESGCMCRGATLIQSLDISDLAPRMMEVITQGDHARYADISILDSAVTAKNPAFFRSPPLSGRILRAHLASLLS